tara:strand:- start:2175 stop:2381 length:207 start_codon:yes stop_codon:yes gene_type:complete
MDVRPENDYVKTFDVDMRGYGSRERALARLDELVNAKARESHRKICPAGSPVFNGEFVTLSVVYQARS